MFSEDDGAKDFILFMTTHRSKGGKWENMYIVGTDEFLHPKAKSDRQQQQEENPIYVAATRTVENLHFVGEPLNCLSVPGDEPEQSLMIMTAPDDVAVSPFQHDQMQEALQDEEDARREQLHDELSPEKDQRYYSTRWLQESSW